MVGCRGSSSLKLSRTTCSRLTGVALAFAICRQTWTKGDSDGVVISRINVGYSLVRRKMRVKVMMQSFFDDGESGLFRNPRRPRTHVKLFCRVSQPPTSIVALIKTMAHHLPWGVRSWSRVVSRVRYLCIATDASEDVALVPEAWAEERSALQLANDAAMAGTCWGSWDVGVDEMRKLSARSVASSEAMGAMVMAISLVIDLISPSLISGMAVVDGW